MMKKLLALFALLVASATASASALQIIDPQPITFTGYNPAPNITGTYTSGVLGQLEALATGKLSATYLGQESSYKNGFSFQSGWFGLGTALSGSASTVALNEYSAIGTTIQWNVTPGAFDFWFRDNHGGWVGNDGFAYKKASFAILQGKCLTSYGCFDFLLGFDDSGGGLDRDFDDFVVGLNLTPVPLPAAAWLFGSALFGFIMLSNRRRI